MSPEAQRVAIAEACGWAKSQDDYYNIPVWNNGGYRAIGSVGLPNYLNDLNAMHEAEKVLNVMQRMDYAGRIFFIMGAPRVPDRTWDEIFDACHVGAGIKAEAFLRTLNLWDDSK